MDPGLPISPEVVLTAPRVSLNVSGTGGSMELERAVAVEVIPASRELPA